MPKTYYLDNILINLALRNTSWVQPAIVYVALYSVAPTASGGGTEITGGGYGRQPVTFNAPTNGATSNVSDVNFPIASTDWGSVVAFAICDTSSGGNILYFGNLSTPRTVLTNDQLRFPAGQLVAQET